MKHLKEGVNMTYNRRTNTLTARVYEGLEPMDRRKSQNGYVAKKVSNSLYNKLKRNQVINWYNPNSKVTWDLIVTRKANNTIWFYLP